MTHTPKREIHFSFGRIGNPHPPELYFFHGKIIFSLPVHTHIYIYIHPVIHRFSSPCSPLSLPSPNEINSFPSFPRSKSGTHLVCLGVLRCTKHELKPPPLSLFSPFSLPFEKRRQRQKEREDHRWIISLKRSTSTGTSVLAALYRAAYK